jgi:predicted metal-binding membrane protein
MPTDTELHKKKRKKNYILLACLISFMALIWAITMIKFTI